MIFYNEYNCTVSKYSQIMKEPKFIAKTRIIPYFACIKRVSKLKQRFNEILSLKTQDEISSELNDNFYLVNLYTRILKYSVLRSGLRIAATEKLKVRYKEYFKKEYHGDLSELDSRIESMTKTYDAFLSKNEKGNSLSFDEYIIWLNGVLSTEMTIDLSTKFI